MIYFSCKLCCNCHFLVAVEVAIATKFSAVASLVVTGFLVVSSQGVTVILFQLQVILQLSFFSCD
jgi:hypothetical protein